MPWLRLPKGECEVWSSDEETSGVLPPLPDLRGGPESPELELVECIPGVIGLGVNARLDGFVWMGVNGARRRMGVNGVRTWYENGD